MTEDRIPIPTRAPKPPLGARPVKFWKEDRINELAGALERRTKAGLYDQTVESWCNEILGLLKDVKEGK